MKLTVIKHHKNLWVVFDEDFPHVSAVGKTKKEAKKNLEADLKEIRRIEADAKS